MNRTILRAAPAILIGIIAAATPTGALGQDQLTPEVLKKVKRATVYLRVTLPDGRTAEGSGFLAGGPNVVITNAHVVGMLSLEGRPPREVEVVVESGEPGEKKYKGEFAQIDTVEDLAVVRVFAKDLPAPLPIGAAKDLLETQNVYIFGFPLGKQLGKHITVTRSTVSGLRKHPSGAIRDVQVAGGMHPGNSGGPMIDAKGQVVGVAVAGIRGTQINFAIPGEAVRTFLGARFHSYKFEAPYKEGDAIKLPISYSMIDPLVSINKVRLDVWTGKPGPARKAVAKIGVAPLPDDSERKTFEMTYKDRVAKLDATLPPLPKGQVYWMQFSIVRKNGSRTWGRGESYNNFLVPVERKPVTIAYKHQPNAPCRLEITAISDYKLRGIDGTDKHLIYEYKAEMIESLRGKPDDKGAMLGLLAFSKLDLKATFDKKEFPEDKILRNSLKSVKLVRAVTRVDNQGDVSVKKLDVNVRNRVTALDLISLSTRVVQSLEAVTVPLPTKELNHDKPWKAQRKLTLGKTRGGQSALVDVTYIYHGVRVRDGNLEALIFLRGEVRGEKGAGSSVSGKMGGQAVVDLKTNQVLFADVHLNLDLDLSDGRDSFQANGSMKIVLNRKVLEGTERDNALKEKPPVVAEGPIGSKDGKLFVKVLPDDKFAFIKQSLKDKRTADVDIRGFAPTKTPYRDAPENGALLIGFQVGTQKFFNNDIIGAFRPIYMTSAGEKMGAWVGKESAKPIELKAKAGYVVGAMNIRTGLGIDGFSLRYIKLNKDRLQPDDYYESDYVGGKGGGPSTIGRSGVLAIGIAGYRNDQGTPCSLGLITILAPKE